MIENETVNISGAGWLSALVTMSIGEWPARMKGYPDKPEETTVGIGDEG
jgi:hypothetical protein